MKDFLLSNRVRHWVNKFHIYSSFVMLAWYLSLGIARPGTDGALFFCALIGLMNWHLLLGAEKLVNMYRETVKVQDELISCYRRVFQIAQKDDGPQ